MLRPSILVAVGQELLGVLQLGIEIAHVDAGGHADLLDLHHMLVFTGLFFAFALLKAILAIVHEFAYGGDSLGRDLDQIQPAFFCDMQRLGGRHDAHLLAVFADETDLAIVDVLVQLMHYLANTTSTSNQK